MKPEKILTETLSLLTATQSLSQQQLYVKALYDIGVFKSYFPSTIKEQLNILLLAYDMPHSFLENLIKEIKNFDLFTYSNISKNKEGLFKELSLCDVCLCLNQYEIFDILLKNNMFTQQDSLENSDFVGFLMLHNKDFQEYIEKKIKEYPFLNIYQDSFELKKSLSKIKDDVFDVSVYSDFLKKWVYFWDKTDQLLNSQTLSFINSTRKTDKQKGLQCNTILPNWAHNDNESLLPPDFLSQVFFTNFFEKHKKEFTGFFKYDDPKIFYADTNWGYKDILHFVSLYKKNPSQHAILKKQLKQILMEKALSSDPNHADFFVLWLDFFPQKEPSSFNIIAKNNQNYYDCHKTYPWEEIFKIRKETISCVYSNNVSHQKLLTTSKMIFIIELLNNKCVENFSEIVKDLSMNKLDEQNLKFLHKHLFNLNKTLSSEETVTPYVNQLLWINIFLLGKFSVSSMINKLSNYINIMENSTIQNQLNLTLPWVDHQLMDDITTEVFKIKMDKESRSVLEKSLFLYESLAVNPEKRNEPVYRKNKI